jgi:hypothetical protein
MHFLHISEVKQSRLERDSPMDCAWAVCLFYLLSFFFANLYFVILIFTYLLQVKISFFLSFALSFSCGNLVAGRRNNYL